MDIGRYKLKLALFPPSGSRDPVVQRAINELYNHFYSIGKDIAVCPGPCEMKSSAGIVKGNAVNISNSLIRHADRTLSRPAIGIAMTAASAGNQIVKVMLGMGYISGLTGLTAGASYYLDTAGVIVTPKPGSGVIQGVGFAISATEFFVTISQPG